MVIDDHYNPIRDILDQDRPRFLVCISGPWAIWDRLITSPEARELQAHYERPAAAGIEGEGEVYQ